MNIDYSFNKKLLWAFAVSCCVVLLLMLAALQLSRNASKAMLGVQHTYQILNHTIQIRSDTFQIELNTQSYRITGDEARIAERDMLIQKREKSLQIIKKIIPDNPRQQSRWYQLRKIIDERLAITRRMVFLLRTQGKDAANAYIATTPLQKTRDEMYKLLVEIENEERLLLDQYMVKQDEARQLVSVVVVVVGILLLYLLIFTFMLIRRQMREIEASRIKLVESEVNLSTTLHSIGDGVIATDLSGRITRMNPVAEKLTGWKFTEAEGLPVEKIFNIINDSTKRSALIPIEKATQTGEVQNLERHTTLIDRYGNKYPIADSASPIVDSKGMISGVVLVFRDETIERNAERSIHEQNELLEDNVKARTFELLASEENLRNVTDNVPALIAYVDANERYLYANQKYLDRYSHENNNIKGLTVNDVLGNERYAIAGPYIKQALLGKTVVYDWQPFQNVWHMTSYVPTEDVSGKITGYYVMISDITDRKLAEIELYNLSNYDALTCLANETQFTNLLNEAIASGTQLNQSFPLLQVNIQNLSEINDALGFSRGDQVLQEFAERLKLAAPPPYKIARLRGEEFAILLDNCSINDAISVAGKIEKLLVQPIVVSNIALDMSAKIGIAVFPEHGSTPHDLYRHIDFAVRQAQKKGTSFQLFDRALDTDKPHRLALAAELRHAIDHNHLELYLQPKIDFNTGQVCGAEALVRWNHVERGMIYPDEFIPLAEQIGLIKPLTQWVIDAAMRLINTWENSGFVMPIAVNISARNLHEDDLVERIRQLKMKWDIGAELFEIEVTESSVMDDAERALQVLQLFQEQNILLSIDDFGTGYSSLSYLQRLPVQSIKIDKSFVQNMLSSQQSLMIVRSTIDLAHDLGKKVVAEGVESREHWDQLLNLGCDIAQGYFIAKPMPVDAFIGWVQSFKSPIATQ